LLRFEAINFDGMFVFKRILFLLLFVLLLVPKAQSCKCASTTIAQNYAVAKLIFYGKHLGTIESKDVFDINGKPIKIEQFEVLHFFKGVEKDNAEPKNNKPTILSIGSNCQNSCGFCYDSNGYYLVYAHGSSLFTAIETGWCSRTKKIDGQQFIISSSSDPDAGKDEWRELERMARNDTANVNLMSAENSFQEEMQQKETRILDLQKQLKKKGSMTIILSTTTLILLIYLAFDWFKKKNKKA
jgi:hypothetical protein